MSETVASVIIAGIAIIPATLAAIWSRSAKTNSQVAKTNSEEAKVNSAGALHEVKSNGGMSDPDPTLKDYIKHVGESSVSNNRRLDEVEALLTAHLKHAEMMDRALADIYLIVKSDWVRKS